jgi:hypothetical protein
VNNPQQNTTDSLPKTDASGNVVLDPPPAGQGVQIVFGPFTVPSDSEVQIDYYFKLPTNIPIDVARIQIATNYGTHHMNLFRYNVPHVEDTEYSFNSSVIWQDGDLMIEAQQHYIDWSMPAGSSVHLDAQGQMALQVHYVNASTQTTPNGKGKVVINLWYATSPVTSYASMLFAQNTHVLILPHSDTTFSKICTFSPAAKPFSIVAMTGHFHSRGKNFTVEKWDLNADTSLGVLYKNVTWNEPPFESYPTPISILSGQGVKYTATYENTTADTIFFGPHVETQEHCNLFLWFIPGLNNGQTIYDNN